MEVSVAEREVCSPPRWAGQAEELGTLGALCLELAHGLKFERGGKRRPLAHITVSTAVSQHH